MSFIAKEADHVEGFAKEMAVVTHHRLKKIDGTLKPDPEAELLSLSYQSTSETIIGDAFSRWIKSYRDLPLKSNQWANVMRWEMRTRMFLRTAEFLWQEGTPRTSTKPTRWKRRCLRSKSIAAEDFLALPVVAA